MYILHYHMLSKNVRGGAWHILRQVLCMSNRPLTWGSFFLHTTNYLLQCPTAKHTQSTHPKTPKISTGCVFCIRPTLNKEIKFSTKSESLYACLFCPSFLFVLSQIVSCAKQESLHLSSVASGIERSTATKRVSNWTESTL